MKKTLIAILLMATSYAAIADDEIEMTCKAGDEAYFTGGFVAGAAGNLLSDPVQSLEDYIKSPKSKHIPLRILWSYQGTMCDGVGSLDANKVYISEPLGGGKIRGGKYLVLAIDVHAENGRKGACLILAQSKDVKCTH